MHLGGSLHLDESRSLAMACACWSPFWFLAFDTVQDNEAAVGRCRRECLCFEVEQLCQTYYWLLRVLLC